MEKLNYKQLVEYLQNNLPSVNDLTNKELRSLPKENILLINEYISLYNGNLSELSNINNYSEQGINNLMVIVSRGYLPLLEFNQIKPCCFIHSIIFFPISGFPQASQLAISL